MHDVAQKRSNAFGLYDMLGNVYEWVNDWYGDDYYQHSPPRDPSGPASGQFRALRGGSYHSLSSDISVSIRFWGDPASADDRTGFRCIWEVGGP
jgi:formylglycine-generating enzyme required for sulfatase activity